MILNNALKIKKYYNFEFYYYEKLARKNLNLGFWVF